MAWSRLVDMAMTPEEEADIALPVGVMMSEAPQYPYGLRITLSDAELEKLGLDVGDANVGDIVDMRAFAVVTSVSQNQKADGTACCRVELQIEKMAVEAEADEGPA